MQKVHFSITPWRAHGDVRVEHQRHRIGPGLDLVVEPVEAPDLVRAVVRAVARADAAVVDHAVQARRRVVGRQHRAHRLAGRRTALLAQHRRVAHVDVAELLVVLRAGAPRLQRRLAVADVALDAQPRHLVARACTCARRRSGCCSRRSRRRRTRCSRCSGRRRSSCPSGTGRRRCESSTGSKARRISCGPSSAPSAVRGLSP